MARAATTYDREEMEKRRLEAARSLLAGAPQSRIVTEYGVSRTTASRWARRVAKLGIGGMARTVTTGRPSRLTKKQVSTLRKVISKPPEGGGDKWTCFTFADEIAIRFGVRYDPDHVGRLMHWLRGETSKICEKRGEKHESTTST